MTVSPLAAAHPPSPPWHAEDADAILTRFACGREGLGAAEAERRLRATGANLLPEIPARSPIKRLLAQINSPLVYVLLAAGGLTAGLGHWADMGVILAVVVVNAAIGFVQEGRAEHAIEAVRRFIPILARVRRDGATSMIAARNLVPGDIVVLEAGDRVPADIRLFEARDLAAQEAALTGESNPVEKSPGRVPADAALADRRCMTYSGTLVVRGIGAGVVVATGPNTEVGRIGRMLSDIETVETPLLRQVRRFGLWLTIAIAILACLTFSLALVRGSYAIDEALLASIGLAVAAIPEGLPAILTIVLAAGVRRMARRGAIIRRLPVMDTLGSVTVICADKTGTLTRNELTVDTIALDGAMVSVASANTVPALRDLTRRLALAAVLCSTATLRLRNGRWVAEGDPTEQALLLMARGVGVDPASELRRHPRLDIIPFEAERRLMATMHGAPGAGATIYVKGAPERLLAICPKQLGRDGEEPLDQEAWIERTRDMAARGQRVLAIAVKALASGRRQLGTDDIADDLVLLGLVGLIDAPRPDAIDAVRRCQAAGIKVKMITGDHVLTAQAIARRIGLHNPEQAATGRDLATLPDGELRRVARETDIFARTTAEDKLRLVVALQDQNHVVAMTGDGVNDAPALRRADVGVAMGLSGTDVARQAAHVVLTDDNFASIAAAVEEGRTVYDNLRKALIYVLPTSFAEALTIVVAVAAGSPLPMTAVQILWVNLVTEVTLSLALAFEPPEADSMAHPPRPAGESLLSRYLLWRVLLVTAAMTIGAYGLFQWQLGRGVGIESARACTIDALVMFEIVYLINSRFLLAPSCNRRGFFGNATMLPAIGTVVVLQALFVHLPVLQELVGTDDLDGRAYGAIALAAIALFVSVELEKFVIRRWKSAPNSIQSGASRDTG